MSRPTATRPAPAPATVVVCGALAVEVREIVRRRGWDVEVRGISAFHHLRPERIAAPLDRILAEVEGRGGRAVVVYGDCGTAGALDRVLAGRGVARTAGPHCYAMFGGPALEAFLGERPGTFLLTDWLVRNFERAVVRPLGLDRYPELKGDYFGHYTDALYLRQAAAPELGAEAERIAAYLGCRLTVWDTGLDPLERELAALLGEEAPAPVGGS